ncbi:MAG TPA: dihydrodipicolinate synthase family protein [Vicinamibacteria bacterium]|nr:dihydrodipicolinate synthase family protein [Vicinamibacteria bacterium]
MAGSEARLRDGELREVLRRGLVIPAHPLALDAERRLDERRQVALTRYYCDAGAGGVAVGVHTTQFAVRAAGMLPSVLRLAAEAARRHQERTGCRVLRIAGAIGKTAQAVAEAVLARECGYDAVLLSLAALRDADDQQLVAHCRQVAEVLPLFGFYLQPAVGGRPLGHGFWRAFLDLERVVAIKVAPFSRYQTLEVARALVESGRSSEVSLYTGNDDAIVADLLTDFDLCPPRPAVRFVGGLLGQWAVWTKRAVDLLDSVKAAGARGASPAAACDLLRLGAQLTDANAALFDARSGFAGCVAGIHEVLRRQGLLAGRYCLDPGEEMSLGQMEEIDRVLAAYPSLNDDAFVAENLDRWLS